MNVCMSLCQHRVIFVARARVPAGGRAESEDQRERLYRPLPPAARRLYRPLPLPPRRLYRPLPLPPTAGRNPTPLEAVKGQSGRARDSGGRDLYLLGVNVLVISCLVNNRSFMLTTFIV